MKNSPAPKLEPIINLIWTEEEFAAPPLVMGPNNDEDPEDQEIEEPAAGCGLRSGCVG